VLVHRIVAAAFAQLSKAVERGQVRRRTRCMLDKAAKKCMIPRTAACLHAWAQGTLFTCFAGTKRTNTDAAAAAGVAVVAQDKRSSRGAAVEGALRDLEGALRDLLRELSAELVEPFKQDLEASRIFQSECAGAVKEAWERMLWQRERGRETVCARRVRRMLARAFVDFCDSVVRVMEQSSWQWARLYRLHQLHVAVQDVQVERRRERERDCVSVVGAITGPLSIYLPTLSHSHTHTHTHTAAASATAARASDRAADRSV
jgi:hypothetical protein